VFHVKHGIIYEFPQVSRGTVDNSGDKLVWIGQKPNYTLNTRDHDLRIMKIHSKLPDIGTTVFTVMSKLASDYDAINLGQGFPDFNPDPKLLDLATQAMKDGHNQYPYMPGIEPLRRVVGEKVSTLYNCTYDVDKEITITSGATEAIMAAILAVVQAGNEVIVIEPNYDCYIPAIKLAGGVPVTVPMTPPTSNTVNFQVDWDRVQDAVTSETRLIIVNFPHNPTGTILKPADLDALEKIVTNTNILLLSDEVYEHIVFDNVNHLSLASRPTLAERTFLISSFGKTTHTTGWKVGYCCAPETMTKELRKVHQFIVFTVPSPLQHALAAYSMDPSTYLELSNFYQKKRDQMIAGLANTRFKTLPCPGTFFLLADYSTISDESEINFAQWLTKTHGVTAIPVSAFYNRPDLNTSNHQLIRFCFAKREETLNSALVKLADV
jgi:methionine transaminase